MKDLQPCWDFLQRVGATGGSKLKDRYQWMGEFKGPAKKVINFGCAVIPCGEILGISYLYSYELFALKWVLNAEQVVVIDKEQEYLSNLKELLIQLAESNPNCFEYPLDWLEVFAVDLTKHSPNLASGYFDFGYCARVLLNIKGSSGEDAARKAVKQMSRVIKIGGIIVSRESDEGQPYPPLYKQLFHEAGFSIVGDQTVRVLGEHIIYQKSGDMQG